MRLWLLRLVRPLLVRELQRIAAERDGPWLPHHQDEDCGFQLLHELGWHPPGTQLCAHIWARRRYGRECAECGMREYGDPSQPTKTR